MTVVRRRMRRQSLKDFLGALYTQQRRFSLEKVRHFQQLRNRRQVMCKLNQICLFLWLTVAIIADMPIKKREKNKTESQKLEVVFQSSWGNSAVWLQMKGKSPCKLVAPQHDHLPKTHKK